MNRSDRIPSCHLVYKVKIGYENISIYLHSYHGLILEARNSIVRCELLHGVILLDDNDEWVLSRYANETSLNINRFKDVDLIAFMKEFGFKKFKNIAEIDVEHLNNFSTSVCFSEINSWAIKHPELAKKYFMSPYIRLSVNSYVDSINKKAFISVPRKLKFDMHCSSLNMFSPSYRMIINDINSYFSPNGVVLEPFSLNGVLYENLPRDRLWEGVSLSNEFFGRSVPVDWLIMTTVPTNILTKIMKHAFSISQNTVLVLPIDKLYNSKKRSYLFENVAGIKEVVHLGLGSEIGYDLKKEFAAVHFVRDYKGKAKHSTLKIIHTEFDRFVE